MAAALDAAHERGLVHRDVKPGNILLSGEGEHEHVYLTDFGLTKRLGSAGSLTRPGAWVGTPDYVAPEQIQAGKVDGRADVYSLGCVLYEMLTGDVAFPKDNDMAKLWAHVTDAPPAPGLKRPDLVPAFNDVVARATAKDPDARYQRASDLAAAVDEAIAQQDARLAPGGLQATRGRGRAWRAPRRSTISSSRSPPRAPGLSPLEPEPGATTASTPRSPPAAAAARCHRRAAVRPRPPRRRPPPPRRRLRPEAAWPLPRHRPPALPAVRAVPSRHPSAAGRWWPVSRPSWPWPWWEWCSPPALPTTIPSKDLGERVPATLSPVPTNKVDGLGNTTRPPQRHGGDGHAQDQRAAERRAPRDAHPRGREGRVPDRGRRARRTTGICPSAPSTGPRSTVIRASP